MSDDERPCSGIPATLTEPEDVEGFAPGQVLAERYRVVELLGRGGIGEVWRAYDLKLRVEVALKALREDLITSDKRLERLRREVRAAREVVSPNVCRIFDLVEAEGRELVSMEYVDGSTLLEVLQERGPLELKEAQDVASQFLAGLEAIHAAGLVHRDVKPENIMLTRSGRVVVMDFGLAREETDGTATGSGTPAYMAPEQAAGQALDARADVYAAGVVLAEMVTPDGVKSLDSRQGVWEGVRSEPAKIADTPWAPVIKRAVARDREARYPTAHTLTRALEDVTLRVEGAEDLHPYPGLASFTEEDAEYFFGREAEIEQMWRRLEGPARMLALVGPSGAGKTSFLQAGLMPHAGPGWSRVILTPGNDPRAALRRAVIVELKDDTEALRELAEGGEDASVSAISRWRRRHDRALVIVDQFEELFTQNAADEQQRFAELLGRLVLEADVVVLVSMRDDFLIHCNRHEELRPLFSELTPLDPPTGAALRRALTQPALTCGYRFEDDELVEEMLGEVEGERGALPLLAFAAARLWEKRDRDSGRLTRQAYHDIGGVGGALARHAEATIDRVGSEHISIVRELFRNLVTADGTRAVREWDELLSIFRDSQRESPAAVLSALIDARLLTSYEVREEERAPTRRLEIIHESLLANWPRLVRWQTQDADAAQLRDQLRQAARTWHEHDRSDDMLWSGSAYREFAVWREGYPGGLSDLEEAFAAAMTSLATRRRRRRRIVVTVVIVVLLAGLAVVGTLWQRSVLETRRAEAAKLLAIAQVQIDTDPSEALAYATASLELADNSEARVFALRALWAGPPVRALDTWSPGEGQFWVPAFSPDGRWLAVAGLNNEHVLVFGELGGDPILLGGHESAPTGPIGCAWTRDGHLVTGHWTAGRARMWAIPEGRVVRTIDFGGPARWFIGGDHVVAQVFRQDTEGEEDVLDLMRWSLSDGVAEDLGSVRVPSGDWNNGFDPTGRAWIYSTGEAVYARPLPVAGGAPDGLIARYEKGGAQLGGWARAGEGFYATDFEGRVTVWTEPDSFAAPGRQLPRPGAAKSALRPDPSGRWLVEDVGMPSGQLGLWDLTRLLEAAPRAMRRSGTWKLVATDFHPSGTWLVADTRDLREITFWPLSEPSADVIEGPWVLCGFTPDGRYMVAQKDEAEPDGSYRARLWPLPGSGAPEIPDLEVPSLTNGITVDANNRYAVTSWYGWGLVLIPLNGGETLWLQGFSANDLVNTVFSPSGQRVAGTAYYSDGQPTLRVWDLDTGEVKVFDQPIEPDANPAQGHAGALAFVDENTLYSAGANGFLRWDLETGTYETIRKAPPGGSLYMSAPPGGRKILLSDFGYGPPDGQIAALFDLDTGELRDLKIPAFGPIWLSLDGTIWVASWEDDTIRVGRIGGGEPHLLIGHEGAMWFPIAVSPDNRWIASSSQDKTLRLWPMPDLDKPPLHTLPHAELVAKLHSLTNIRVVRDEASFSGWKLEIGPFPGWAEVPEW